MNDEQLLDEVGSWLKETDAAHPDTERITEQAMAQVPAVRQRGRWWPLPFLDRHRELEPVPGSSSPLSSALKLVAAGIIVGLFGGFLLAGLLVAPTGEQADPAGVTDPPAPMTTDRLRAIAGTVEVEPGVLRVTHDSAKDLGSADGLSLVAGRDGGIWVLTQDGFRRFGSDEQHVWPSGSASSADFAVTPAGTVWSVRTDDDGRLALQSFDGERWTSHAPTSDTYAVEIAPDGIASAIWQDQGSEAVVFGQLADGGQQPVAEWLEGELHGGDLYLTEAGETWIVGGPRHREGKPRLHRLVDGVLVQAYDSPVVAADVGADGTAWLVSVNELIRLDGTAATGAPQAWALPDTLTAAWGTSRWSLLPGDAMRATPDGSVWFALRAVSEPPFSDTHCRGVTGFDGTSWLGPFLTDRCVESIELGVDGSVWLLATTATDDSEPGLFVVTPTVSTR